MQGAHIRPILKEGDRVSLIFWIDRDLGLSAATHPDTVLGVCRRESGVPQFEVTILKEFKEEVMSSDMTMEEVLGMSNTELMGR